MRIVVASSDKAYGTAPRLPYDESMPLNGRHPYDASKSCTDIIAQTYHHSYGLPVCITRAGNFFGGRDLNFNRIVPGVARWAINGERPVLRSDGGMIRDYIYVRDVVLAYLALAEGMEDTALHGHAFNFSTGQPLPVIALVRRILAAAGREDLEPVILGEASNEIPEQHLSAAKARAMLGGRRPSPSMPRSPRRWPGIAPGRPANGLPAAEEFGRRYEPLSCSGPPARR